MEEILERLERVRKTGNGYRASCPVHGEDKDPSLSIAHRDGKIIMHCFACLANGLEVVQALGISPDILFDEKREFVRDPNWLLKKTVAEDDTLILIAQAAEQRGERLKYSDRKALQLALARRDQREAHGIDQVVSRMDIKPYGL